MAQVAKHLPCKCENLSSDLQTPRGKLGMVMCAGEVETGKSPEPTAS